MFLFVLMHVKLNLKKKPSYESYQQASRRGQSKLRKNDAKQDYDVQRNQIAVWFCISIGINFDTYPTPNTAN